MQWLIDLIKEWVIAQAYATVAYVDYWIAKTIEWVEDQNYLQTSFVDRGDPAAWDFIIGNFTADGAWHDLNLSSIVPAGAKSVLFLVYIRNDAVNKDFYLRRKGNANAYNMVMQRTEVANLVRVADGVCPCDENRVIQYYLTAVGWTRIRLTVKGWWL